MPVGPSDTEADLERYRELRAIMPLDMDGANDEQAESGRRLYEEVAALRDRLGDMVRDIRPRLVIADIDGTWVHPASGDAFPRDEHDWEMLPGRRAMARWLWLHEVPLALASNQGGVAFGHRTLEQARYYVNRIGWRLHAQHVQLCPHHPSGTMERYRRDCPYRKPHPGMLLSILHEADVAPEDALYVGDREEDELAAVNAGIPFAWAHAYFSAGG
jgi:D-glycero-D-manno-heptose 1,7-bisphosphate phosphatase